MPRRVFPSSERPGRPWPGRGEKVAPLSRRGVPQGRLFRSSARHTHARPSGSARCRFGRVRIYSAICGSSLPGTVVAGYRIESLVGRGGMGVVYRAFQLDLERVVALKVIAPELLDDDDVRARFLTEARAAASVDHPNVIPVHAAGEDDGVAYIAMRFVAGDDLRSLVRHGGPLDPAGAAAIVAQAAAALDAIHRAGFVHRDVKPANLLVDRDGHVYLTDFGLAKAVLPARGGTRTGQWVGTLDYVSPEQIRGGRIDARADVYALGGVLHFALTGRVPFEREGDEAKLWAQLSAPPPVPSALRGGLPGAVRRRGRAGDGQGAGRALPVRGRPRPRGARRRRRADARPSRSGWWRAAPPPRAPPRSSRGSPPRPRRGRRTCACRPARSPPARRPARSSPWSRRWAARGRDRRGAGARRRDGDARPRDEDPDGAARGGPTTPLARPTATATADAAAARGVPNARSRERRRPAQRDRARRQRPLGHRAHVEMGDARGRGDRPRAPAAPGGRAGRRARSSAYGDSVWVAVATARTGRCGSTAAPARIARGSGSRPTPRRLTVAAAASGSGRTRCPAARAAAALRPRDRRAAAGHHVSTRASAG